MKRNYGIIRPRATVDGGIILRFPPALVRECRLRAGDTVSITGRKAGGWFCRFYRREGKGWFRLLPNGESRLVRRLI